MKHFATPRELTEFVANGGVQLPPQLKLTAQEGVVEPYVGLVMIGTWPDVDPPENPHPRHMAQVYRSERIHILDFPVPHAYVRGLIDSMAHDLWNHELHEHLRFAGEYIHHPHPDGRRGRLG